MRSATSTALVRAGREAAVKAPVLVLGANGAFGASLAGAVLASGKPVLAVGVDEAALDTLRQTHAGRQLRTLSGSVASDAGAAALAASLRSLPVIPRQALVNLQAGCVRGRLLDESPGLMERALHEHLLPQLYAARHLVPVLASSGRCARYLVVGTPYAGTPWAGYGHYSVAAAAIRMLIHVLRQETADTPVRVQQLVIDSPVRSEDNAHCACPDWPDATQVARLAAEVLDRPEDGSTFIPFQAECGHVPRQMAEVRS